MASPEEFVAGWGAQEWLRGGHLFDKLEEMAGQHYSEQQASILFTQARLARGQACMGWLCRKHRAPRAVPRH